MLIGAVSSFAGKGRVPGPVFAPPGYGAVQSSIPDLVALWRLGESSGTTIVDDVAGRNGTITGTVSFGAPALPEFSDGAINFAGTGTAAIPHNAAFALSAFTLSFWFKPGSIPDEESPNTQPVVSKEVVGRFDGDMSFSVRQGGIVRVRFDDGTNFHDLESAEGAVQTGVAYHVVIRADATGADFYLNGALQGSRDTTYTSAWTNNTASILLATNPGFVSDGDCTLDEIALYSRVLTEAEVITLSQRTQLPVAVDDAANVPESAATNIDVTTNDTYVGSKAGLTVSIVAQPSGGDSVAVDGGNNITYTAGAVTGDTARTFQYRIADPIGTSNTATVGVTVLNAGAPASNQANCYTENTNDAVTIGTGSGDIGAALQTAISAAPPGRTILIAPGTYTGGTRTLNPSGTIANPVVVRPQNGIGTVTINGAVWTLPEGSSRLVLSKFYFNSSRFIVNGSRHRFTRLRFKQITNFTFSLNVTTDLRIDHCDFSDHVLSTTQKGVWILDDGDAANGVLKRILFDYNYIHDITHPTAMQAGGFMRETSSGNAEHVNDMIVLDHCLFRNNNVEGQGEFIVVKHAGRTIRYCTFENQSGYLQQRQSGGWEVRSCWFENMSNSAPLKCFDKYLSGSNSGAGRQLVIGNHLVGQTIWVGSGSTVGVDNDEFGGGVYHRSRQGQFIGNTVTGAGQIRVGEIWSTQPDNHPALNNNLWDNTGTVVQDHDQGTTFTNPATNPPADPPTSDDHDPWYTYEPAEKLTPSHVGLAAPDPLCPSGPQM